MKYRFFLSILLILAVSACTPAATAAPTSIPAAEATQVPAANTPENPAPAATGVTTTDGAEDVRTYAIIPEQSKASYSVGEVFINDNNRFNTAVGVTQKIDGQIFLNFSHPEKSSLGKITVDISLLTSDSSRRDNAIRNQWLESSRFPLAVFQPKTIQGLPTAYQDGTPLDLQVSGDLTIRDTTRPVTFAVKAALAGDKLTGTADTTILMSDFNFPAPDIAGMLKAQNEAKIHFDFVAGPVS